MRNALGWPGCPPRFRREGFPSGLRFSPMGSEDGGLDELVEFWLSRACNSAIRFSRASKRTRSALWASAGTVFQSDWGMGGLGIIEEYYAVAVRKVRSVNGYHRS